MRREEKSGRPVTSEGLTFLACSACAFAFLVASSLVPNLWVYAFSTALFNSSGATQRSESDWRMAPVTRLMADQPALT